MTPLFQKISPWYSNDLIGKFEESNFKEEPVESLCLIDKRQPMVFEIDYLENKSDDDYSDEGVDS